MDNKENTAQVSIASARKRMALETPGPEQPPRKVLTLTTHPDDHYLPNINLEAVAPSTERELTPCTDRAARQRMCFEEQGIELSQREDVILSTQPAEEEIRAAGHLHEAGEISEDEEDEDASEIEGDEEDEDTGGEALIECEVCGITFCPEADGERYCSVPCYRGSDEYHDYWMAELEADASES